MEFYYHEVDNDVLIISADGGIDKQTSKEFVEQILELIDGGMIIHTMPEDERPVFRDGIYDMPEADQYLERMDADLIAVIDALRSEPYDESARFPDWSPSSN